MCSIGEDDFGDDGGIHSMTPERNGLKKDRNGQCKKCNKSNIEVFKLFFRDFECEDCFLAASRHKFRATLGSSKVLPKNANVLLVFDGYDASEALLDMTYYAQTQNNYKRLHCTVKIIYIDESSLKQGKEDETRTNLSKLQNQMLKYPAFDCFITSLTNCNSPGVFNLEQVDSYLHRSCNNELDFGEKFRNIKSLTSRQDMLKYQRNKLISGVAQHLNCGFVFLPDIGETLATQLLTAITLGRGESAAYDVALVDDRLGENVKTIRPLRDLTQPEIELYVNLRDLKPLKTKDDAYGIPSGPSASLQNLTRSFVESLQNNYSSTVSTVYRCCDKIAPKTCLNQDINSLAVSKENLGTHNLNRESKDLIICTLCGSPLPAERSKTLLAIEFSRIVSQKGATSNDCMELDVLAKVNLDKQTKENSLCHACHNIAKDQNNPNLDFLL